MKKFTSLALIGAILAGITGFVSLDTTSAISLITMQGPADMRETGLMIGHVTYEVRGMDGQIKHYFQSDNVITDIGTDCSAKAIFGTTDITVCPDLDKFAYIAIGNATSPSAGETDTALSISGGGSASFGDGISGDEMARSGLIDASITKAVSPDDTEVSIVSTPFEFTDLGAAGTTVTQSGLFDSGTVKTGNMFAIKNIVSGGLDVFSTDKLTVTWTITLS